MQSLTRVGNWLKTGAMLALLTALALFVGQWLGGARGLAWAALFVVVMNVGSYWFSDRIALAMHGAKPLDLSQAPELHDLVAELARKGNLPMPRLYLIDTSTPNAFATGRNPQHAAVAVTSGLLNLMNRRELTGVLAHELSHVSNRDTLTMTVAATLAGVITHVAQMLFFWGGALFSGGPGGHRDEEDEGHGLAALGLMLVAPVAATLLQLAISRSREFGADESASQLTGDPEGLARALARLEVGNRAMPYNHSPGTAHLFIVNPLSGGGLLSLFSTHPPIDERVERLMAMAPQGRLAYR